MPTTEKGGSASRVLDHASALPCGSASMRRTRDPSAAKQAARLTATVVLPTPPFWLRTPMIMGRLPGRPAGGADPRICALHNVSRWDDSSKRETRQGARNPAGFWEPTLFHLRLSR